MIDKFQEHFDEQEVQVWSIQAESSEWEERLKMIDTEAAFFYKLLTAQFSEELTAKINLEDSNYLQQQVKSIKEINNFHQKTFQDYKLKQEGLKECDDVQCENFYLKDHLIFKKTLTRHFKAFRELKFIIHKYIGLTFS